MRHYIFIPVLLILAVAALGQDTTRTFYVNDDLKRDVVTFTLKGPLQTVVGKTADIKGFIEVNPGNLPYGSVGSASPRARFEVDLATLRTGIGARDSHMRKSYLETEKYPKAIFELLNVKEASQNHFEDQRPIKLTLEGNLTIHGVTRQVEIPVTVTYFKQSDSTRSKMPGDLLRIQGVWDLLLSDYHISRPRFVLLRLDDKERLEVDLFAATGLPPVMVAEGSTK